MRSARRVTRKAVEREVMRACKALEGYGATHVKGGMWADSWRVEIFWRDGRDYPDNFIADGTAREVFLAVRAFRRALELAPHISA